VVVIIVWPCFVGPALLNKARSAMAAAAHSSRTKRTAAHAAHGLTMRVAAGDSAERTAAAEKARLGQEAGVSASLRPCSGYL
jgi:hypothetical protein